MTSIRLGVSGSTAADDAHMPKTSQDVPIDDPSPVSGFAGRPVRMSREEQQEVRQQSVQGLHQLMMGFDQVSGRHDAVPNAAVPGVAPSGVEP